MKDSVGRVLTESSDVWMQRAGIANALELLADCVPEEMAMEFIGRLVPEKINDRNGTVRTALRKAVAVVIDRHGEKHVDQLLPIFENLLDNTPNDQVNDNLRMALVILIGTTAQHIDRSSPKIRLIIDRLIVALSTPSQQVIFLFF